MAFVKWTGLYGVAAAVQRKDEEAQDGTARYGFFYNNIGTDPYKKGIETVFNLDL